MIKIKEINQSYTMEEITAIVDELYPYGEFKIKEDKRYIYTDGRNFEFDHKKKALMEILFNLNKYNSIIAGNYNKPLRPEECEEIITKRETAYKELNELVNPEALQLSEEKEPQQVTINFYQNNYIQKNYTQNNNTQNNYSYAYTQSQKEDDSEIKEPQQDKHNRLITITDESLDEFSDYFISTFKGMGKNGDRFNDYLVPALKKCLTIKDFANLLYACFNSECLLKKYKESWNGFLTNCYSIFDIKGYKYKPNELKTPDYNDQDYYEKYWWLLPPNNLH